MNQSTTILILILIVADEDLLLRLSTRVFACAAGPSRSPARARSRIV
jgi:hypothetical protein